MVPPSRNLLNRKPLARRILCVRLRLWGRAGRERFGDIAVSAIHVVTLHCVRDMYEVTEMTAWLPFRLSFGPLR